MRHDITQAMDYLGRRPLVHTMMTEALKKGAKILYVSGSGVLLRYSGYWFISAENESTVDIILEMIDRDSMCVLCGSVGLEKITALYKPTLFMDCYQAVYTKKEKLLIPDNMDIRRLDISNLAFVREHYTHVDDEEYISERLRNGLMYGCYVQGNLAGFIGRHDEGSMGLLEVLPEYRGLGIGSALETYMINVVLDEGGTPFGQLRVENDKSLGLQKSLGLEIAPEHIYWIG